MVAFLIAVAMAAMMVGLQPDMPEQADARAAGAYAQQYLVYRDAVIDYADENPGFTGTVALASLNRLPPNFDMRFAFDNRITGAGDVYVYANLPARGLRNVLGRIEDHGLTDPAAADHRAIPYNIGVRDGANIISPRYGVIHNSPPAFVPDGWTVSFVRFD